MESQLRVGVDVGCHAHRVGIADPDGSILEEFDISHSEAGSREFFRRVEERRAKLGFPVAAYSTGGGVKSSLLVFHSLGASRRRRRHVRLFRALIRHNDSIGRACRSFPSGTHCLPEYNTMPRRNRSPASSLRSSSPRTSSSRTRVAVLTSMPTRSPEGLSRTRSTSTFLCVRK